MPYNGSGTFTPLTPPTFPAISGAVISATYFNAIINDLISNGLNIAFTRDGQSAMSANLPMGGNKITGLANGVNPTDGVAFGQLALFAPLAGAAFTGAVTVAGAISATGNATIGGNAAITGTLGAGATTVTTLATTGAVTMASTLAVAGNATFGGTMAITGAVTLAAALSVANGGTGATTAAVARTALGIGSMATRAVTISTSAPSGGVDGDVWFQY